MGVAAAADGLFCLDCVVVVKEMAPSIAPLCAFRGERRAHLGPIERLSE